MWRTDKKPEGKAIIVGLWVNYTTEGETYFEQHIVQLDPDTGYVLDTNGEYYDCWDWDDYTHWQELLPEPEEK
jgi:hypothetical protein